MNTTAGLWKFLRLVFQLVISTKLLTASDIDVGGLDGSSSANELVLFPRFPLTTESPDQGFLPTAAFERPLYTIGTIHSGDVRDGGPSSVTQQTIIELLNNGNMSFTRVTLQDYGSDDVSAFKKAVQGLRLERPDAVVGHYSWVYAAATEHMRIPYFVTSLTPREQPESSYLIQLFPPGAAFAQASEDTLNYYKLNKIAVFYDTEIGQVVLERLAQRIQMEVTGFVVTRRTQSKIRDHLKVIRSHYFNTILAVLNPENTKYLLDQGLSLSMFSPPHKWILLNMGLTEYTLQNYTDSRANITVLRLMMDFNSESCLLNQGDMTLETAAFHDAVHLSAQFIAMKAASYPNQRRFGMRKAAKNLMLEGCTGLLEFSKFGRRQENFLQVMTLQGYLSGATFSDRISKVWDWNEKEPHTPEENRRWSEQWSGTWRSGPGKLNQRMEPFRSYSAISKIGADIFPDTPLRITIINEPPFIQKKTDTSIDTGHPVFEGFCIDILIEMSNLLGFKFNISEVPDGKFGSLKPPPRGWTGMIRQLVDDKADMALAPFQMSTERAEVVDFTKPFMTKGTTVVVKRPDHKIGMFQFLSPFSHVVWSAIFVAFVGTSLMLFAVSRVNSDQHAKYAHNLRESFWYIWGTLLRGSLTGSPHAISSRIVSSAWWFFALIISSIYTANLAAFLTITISDVGINTAADLALQDVFDYGTVEGSQTEKFFKYTQMTYYTRMWAHMSVYSPKSMSRRVPDGFRRVREGKYAFIWDSPTIRHTISNDCDLMEIGSPFDLKGYGFAYQKNAPYGDKLSWALLKMQDDGVLYKLERKWWRPQICPNQKQSAKTESLDLETSAGMYVVILSGALISLLICLLQFLYGRFTKKRKLRKKENGQRQDSDDRLSQGDDVVAGYPGNKPTGADNDITYANHSPAYFRDPDDWKLKYDSY
ncbi:hypothetical protein RRG08_006867 [Elysia crispata]|uniref:Uncharacterized protein n=1 Tax=Elysia crispata TaxID=231223 RepID=A0AAE1EC13_9GAST|nr:hypothetical protein RRG08_006867 [Elysia crispata]